MTGRAFVDTNVLVYAFDTAEPAKRAIALELLGSDLQLVVSTQVLGEFFVAVTRKLATPLPVERAKEAISELVRIPTVLVDATLVLAAVDTAHAHQLSYWDAQIVEAAATAGCERLLTEDLADGATLRGVRIENPFAAAGPPPTPRPG